MATKKKPTKRKPKLLKALSTQLREPGVIAAVFYGKEDHGILTCSIRIDFNGSTQSFGNLCLTEELGPDFVRAVCVSFGVKVPTGLVLLSTLRECLGRLIGERCYALRCFDDYNTPIEGLENQYGDAFLLTTWRRQHFPDTKSPFETRKAELRQRIESAKQQIARAKVTLAKLPSEYYDWEARDHRHVRA